MEKVFSPFIKCRHPTVVHTPKGDMVMRCNHCDLCFQSKSDSLSMALQREEGSHLASFFITLTYAPEWIPYYIVEDKKSSHSIYTSVKSSDPFCRKKEYFRYDLPYQSVVLRPQFLRKYSKRGSDEYEVLDCDDEYYPNIEVVTPNFESLLIEYNEHRKLYKTKYCKTNFEHTDGIVAIAPKRDLELFILRLKNYAVRKCNGATFRYFAIPDYGTNGCAPHWHILLFTDSSELSRQFLTGCKNYGTSKRPSYSAEFIHSLWMYGITNTSRVSKSCGSYVAGYINRPSNFPRLLVDVIKQRSYHSSHLGSVLPQKEVYTQLKRKNFTYFESVLFSDNEGYVSTYEWQRKDYLSYLPCLPYVERTNFAAFENFVLEVKCFIDKCYRLYGNVSLVSISTALFDYASSSRCSITLRDYLSLQLRFNKPFNHDINLFYRIVLSVSRIICVMRDMEITFAQYCDLLDSYEFYHRQKILRNVYSYLEKEEYVGYASIYYDLIRNDFNNQLSYQPFIDVFNRSIDRFNKSVKHRSTAELYKFN